MLLYILIVLRNGAESQVTHAGVSFTSMSVAQSFTSFAYLKNKVCDNFDASSQGCDLTYTFLNSNRALVRLTPNALKNWGTSPNTDIVSVNANGVIIFDKKLDVIANTNFTTDGINYQAVFGASTTTVPCICSDDLVSPINTKLQSRLSILECFFNVSEHKKMLQNPNTLVNEGHIYYQRNFVFGLNDEILSGGSVIISWENLFLNKNSDEPSYFQVEIFDNGNLRVNYGNISLTSGEKCAVGYEDTQYVTFVDGAVTKYYGFPALVLGCEANGLCNDISANSGFFFCKFFLFLLYKFH